jgi:hypothetical protein
MKKIYHLLILMTLGGFISIKAAITTPYETNIVLKQINSAEKERLRLRQIHNKFDEQPTGFYLDKSGTVAVNVEILTPAADGALPTLSIGTMGFNVDGRTRYANIPLREGENIIKLPDEYTGGLIYFRFVTNMPGEPVGTARITFAEGKSEHRRAPKYVKGVTTREEFVEMWTVYDTPDITCVTDYAVICATREAARLFSYSNDKDAWLQGIDDLLAWEDEISGMDNNDPNPVHHRMNPGSVRFLLVENTSSSPHANSAGYTGYPSASRARYLTAFTQPGGGNDIWMLAHELGHQHQQSAYRIPQATESTVNIYSRFAQQRIVGNSYVRTPDTKWEMAWNTFMTTPLEERLYDMSDDGLKAMIGFDHNEFRFLVWEQLFLLFGDDFYKTLHRVVREENEDRASGDDSRYYLIWKASQVSGYDLRDYFREYGIRIVSDVSLQSRLDKNFTKALDRGTIIPPPKSVAELLHVTGEGVLAHRYDWTPLPLRGITTGVPEINMANKSNWTVTANIQGPSDPTGYGDDVKYMIDESTTSFYSFVKPGVSYGGITAPGDYLPAFVINMQTPQKFDSFVFSHRADHSSQQQTMLRADHISVYGSNTSGEGPWEAIVENTPIAVNLTSISYELPHPVTYQYLKTVINDWGKAGGSTIQVSEFGVGESWMSSGLPKISRPASPSITLCPNPVKAGTPFRIQISDAPGAATVHIYNVAGQRTASRTADGANVEMTLSSPGIYIVSVRSGNHLSRPVKLIVRN